MQLQPFPYEMGSAVAALQNSFKKRCKIAVKWLAAAVAKHCHEQPFNSFKQRFDSGAER